MKTVTYNYNEYRLVPVVATHEMCSAPDSVWLTEAKVIWSQMLEAAPPAIEESLKVGEDVVDETSTLEEWLKREMPSGTVISDPSWWAKRIARYAIYIRPKCDAADAARYRFLRGLGWFEAKYGEFEYSGDVTSDRVSADLDACIDHAMARRGEVG